MARVLVTAACRVTHLPVLAAAGHDVTHRAVDSPMPRDELLAAVAGADALVATLVDRVDTELSRPPAHGCGSSRTSPSGTTTSTSPDARSAGSSSPTPQGCSPTPPPTSPWRWCS